MFPKVFVEEMHGRPGSLVQPVMTTGTRLFIQDLGTVVAVDLCRMELVGNLVCAELKNSVNITICPQLSYCCRCQVML